MNYKINVGISYGETGKLYMPGEVAALDEFPADDLARFVERGIIEATGEVTLNFRVNGDKLEVLELQPKPRKVLPTSIKDGE